MHGKAGVLNAWIYQTVFQYSIRDAVRAVAAQTHGECVFFQYSIRDAIGVGRVGGKEGCGVGLSILY